jgi:hypothetical protein
MHRTRRGWSKLAGDLAELGVWAEASPEAAAVQQQAVAGGAYPLTLPVFKPVWFRTDGEDMAEFKTEDVLRAMAPALKRHGVVLTVGTVIENNGETYVVSINGRNCVLWTAEDGRWSWLTATLRPLLMVNDLLDAAGATVRVSTLSVGSNDGVALLLNPAVVAAMRDSGVIKSRDLPELVRPETEAEHIVRAGRWPS